MDFAIDDLQTGQIYQLLTGGVTPRPIAWVSTISEDGIENIAPYSFFNVASINPPILSIAHIAPEAGHDKDTLANIKATGEAVVNLVDMNLAQKMNASSASFAHDINEFDELQITTAESKNLKVKAVAEAKMWMECRLNQIINLSDKAAGGQLILLDVIHIHIDEQLISDDQIDFSQFHTIGKLGANRYCQSEQQFELQRP